MKSKNFILVCAIGFVASVSAPGVWATTIFDNTGYFVNGGQLVQPQNNAGSGSYAQAFTTTAVDATITDIELRLSTFFTGNYSVDIYASDGSVPTGPVVANVFSGGTDFPSPKILTGLNIALSLNTQYFIAVSVTSGSLLWTYTNAYTDLNAFDNGTGWGTSTAQPLQMKVSAVPEPSTWALLILVGIGFAVARSRRSRSSSTLA
jgi:hypothetical protein